MYTWNYHWANEFLKIFFLFDFPKILNHFTFLPRKLFHQFIISNFQETSLENYRSLSANDIRNKNSTTHDTSERKEARGEIGPSGFVSSGKFLPSKCNLRREQRAKEISTVLKIYFFKRYELYYLSPWRGSSI